MVKQLVKSFFSAFGLEVRKKIHAPLEDPVGYNSRENTDKFYANAKLVARYEDERRIAFYKRIVKESSSLPDFRKLLSIADASAGTGRLLAEFRNSFPDKKYSGFEFSDSALALCKKNIPEAELENRDLYSVPEKAFDLVLCIDTLEHLEHPEKALDNLLAMTNREGYLLLVVPNGRYDTFEGHIHYWSPESFRLFIEGMNCKILHSSLWDEFAEQMVIIRKP